MQMILHPVAVKVPKKLPEDFIMPDEVNLEVFLKALSEAGYVYVKDLILWDIALEFVEFTKLVKLYINVFKLRHAHSFRSVYSV